MRFRRRKKSLAMIQSNREREKKIPLPFWARKCIYVKKEIYTISWWIGMKRTPAFARTPRGTLSAARIVSLSILVLITLSQSNAI